MTVILVENSVNGHDTVRRTRVLHQRQSKYGCRTCKERKVRCDQEVPACMRCQKSGRECTGYEKLSKSQGTLYHNYMGLQPTLGSPPRPGSHHSMIRLALDIFTSDPHRLSDRTNAEIFQVLLPQLVFTRPCVGAAAAAAGAAYDMSVKRSAHTGVDLVLELYIAAIREIKQELQRKELELVPMLMAAFLLAAAESIQQQHNVAFNHIAGAFGMATLPPDRVKPHNAMQISQTFGFGALLSLFFSLDLQISYFTWGRQPGFPPMPIEDHMHNPTTLDHLLTAQPVLHQRCLHFIGNAAHSICIRGKCVLHKLDQEQSDLIAWLNRWLSAYNLIINRPETTTSLSDFRHLQLLKAQTLTTLISTSNVKPLTQSSYDIYAPQFEEIISLAEDILRYVPTNPSTATTSRSHSPTSSSTTTTQRSTPPPPTEPSVLTPVSAVPGIIHPLFYTARKYRHPTQRRRAIALLARAGIEGPLHGPCEALIASQIVALEEEGGYHPWLPVHEPATISASPHLRYPTPSSPPTEGRRVCVAWLVHETGCMARKGIWGSTFPSESARLDASDSDSSLSRMTNAASTSTPTSTPTTTEPATPSPFWKGGDPQAPRRRWLRISRRRRGPLGTGWGGEDVPGNFGDGGAGAGNGKVQGGGEIRMLDGDGICSWRELLGEGSWEDWDVRRGWGGVESCEL